MAVWAYVSRYRLTLETLRNFLRGQFPDDAIEVQVCYHTTSAIYWDHSDEVVADLTQDCRK
jgi:hypothetical protein